MSEGKEKKTLMEEGEPSPKPSHFNLHKMTLMAILLALAIAIGYVESLIPAFLPVGGVKLGFANIIIVVVLYELGVWEAASIDLGKVLVVALLRGSFLQMGFFMSLSGAVSSLLIMVLLKLLVKPLTEVGVSAVGSMFHSFGQVAVGALFMGSGAVFYYYCYLMPIALLTGVIVGIAANRIMATKVIARQKRQYGFD
jgi:heptaprenyl diphosphate synthase